MKSDIDRLMAERGLDALIIFGDETPNPHRAYITNGHESNATVFKVQGQPAVMLTNSMEVENAKQSGLEVATYNEFNLHELWKDHADDPQTRTVKTYERFFERFGIHGRVGVYGFGNLGASWETLKLLSASFPDMEFIGEQQDTLFDEAVTTKDADEIKQIKDVGRRTNLVMQETRDFLAGHRAEGDTVVKADGSPLTIGDVKAFVRLKLLEYELEDTEGMIFAQGRDGGFPHSSGTDTDPLHTGRAIVFDLFPRDIHNGYYHDMTRTWCIESAPPQVEKAYNEVMAAFNAVTDALKVGDRTKTYQEIALDVLEGFGHPTGRRDPGTSIGYMHSLGHGLGLSVHERPSFTHRRDNDVLQVGNVFTVEPGVYYPDDGYGIRIEDTLYVAEDGSIHSLTPMPKDLIIKLQG